MRSAQPWNCLLYTSVRYRQKGSSLYPGVPDRLAADHFRAPDQHVLAAVRAPGSCPFIVLIIFKEDIPMKKLLALLLSLAMALSLAACGGGETAQQEPGGDEMCIRDSVYPRVNKPYGSLW